MNKNGDNTDFECYPRLLLKTYVFVLHRFI